MTTTLFGTEYVVYVLSLLIKKVATFSNLENLVRITILNQYRYKYLKEFWRIAIMNDLELDFILPLSKNLCHKGEFSYKNLCI